MTTRFVQEKIALIGEQLGFLAVEEYSFPTFPDLYTPKYDVIWLLDVEQFEIEKLSDLPLVDGKYIPFAAFEIEGSTTSSKNQIGNIGNLRLSPCYFNFLIVNNAEAAKENDTYRRAIKIVRTMQRMMGERPLFLFDASMLENLPLFHKTTLHANQEQKIRLKGSGGEKDSILIADQLVMTLSKSRLQIEYDRIPDYFKWAFHHDKKFMPSKQYTFDPISFKQMEIRQAGQYYYRPKIDIAVGFHVRGGFLEFLMTMAERLKSDAVHFPMLQYLADVKPKELYYPLLGIEIEMRESKHAMGGLMNLTNFHQFGWIVAPAPMGHYIETYKHHLGVHNVKHIYTEDL